MSNSSSRREFLKSVGLATFALGLGGAAIRVMAFFGLWAFPYIALTADMVDAESATKRPARISKTCFRV